MILGCVVDPTELPCVSQAEHIEKKVSLFCAGMDCFV